MGRLDATYARMPVPLQNAGVTAYGMYWRWLRFGPGYRRYVRGFEERERFGAQEWRRWTDERLRSFLGAAAEVPHYARTWSDSERKAARAGRLEDLPLLGKEPLRADPRAFLQPRAPRRRRYVFHTSGSTGTPIATIWSAQEIRRSMAVREVRSARWAGTSFGLPRATFSGRMVVPDPESAGPYHRFNRVERQAYLSPFHLRADTARAYVDALDRHGIEWLTGYAVSYYLLARFILEQKLEVPRLRAVVTTSEKLTARMREVMTEAFRCGVFEEYSTVENALFASECEKGRLHVSPDVGIVEILRPDGTPCDPDEPGEVVATCVLRGLQPLVRYRLGDQAVWSGDPCPCGRSLPVIKEVLGRVEDVVVGPDGRQMVRFHGIFVNQPHVREGQIIQERLDRIRVRVVPAAGYGEADERDIVGRVQQRLGPGTEVVVEAVDQIPRTAAGKFQPVVSLLRDQGVAAAERTGGL
jgi:phenylacetate-CoA ligase